MLRNISQRTKFRDRLANYFALQDNPYPEVLSSNVQKTLIYAGIPFSEALAVEEN